MQLKVKVFEFLAGRPIAMLNQSTASRINVHVGERILISKSGDSIISITDVSKDFIKPNEIAVSREIIESLNLKEGDMIEVSLAEKPQSAIFIKKKLDGKELNKNEISAIIKDIVNNALTEAEIAYFVSAVYKNGMISRETEDLINAMVSAGKKLSFSGEVVDKHSISGIAGNRTTPLIVSICASAGLKMPKTSSRAITSAAGTADVIESIAKVDFSPEEVGKIVEKTGACMVWGGSLGLSPADDKLIQTEKILSLDPEAQLIASILSKKISVGSKYILIDIPYGKSAKVSQEEGKKLKKKFEYFGKKFGLILKCVLTKGEEPIGKGIGPLLEIRDIIRILKRDKDAYKPLENKSVFLAGEIFELVGKAKKGQGKKLAKEILDSGKALRKFKEIITAQKGKIPSIEEINSRLGKIRKEILSSKNSRIKEIDNKKINQIASIAGSPMDKGAGISLNKHLGDKIKKAEKILTIYSDSEIRLKNAIELYGKIKPVVY
jgi:AMP phosphorylase